MSLLLKDKVYTIQSTTAKRGIYPLHSYKLGLYRLPIKLEDQYEIDSIVIGLKKTFGMDAFADRVYATYYGKEENIPDPIAQGYKQTEAEPEVSSGAKSGPIDVGFKTKLKVSETFTATSSGNKIKIFGPRKGNEILGIWGEYVSVDFDICIGDGACIDACPVKVYEWAEFLGNPSSEKKPLMSREPDCIFCLACENVCPVQAIKIAKKG